MEDNKTDQTSPFQTVQTPPVQPIQPQPSFPQNPSSPKEKKKISIPIKKIIFFSSFGYFYHCWICLQRPTHPKGFRAK